MQTTTTFKALGEPHRLRIVEFLRDGPRPVNDVVAHLGTSQPHVSKHLRVLSESGLATCRPQGRERIYDLAAEPFTEMQQWIDTFERVWDQRLDRLDAVLRADDPNTDGSKP